MELKQLIQDEDAVSPVIGVILMVAITVILAAVIGTFVLGLGDQVQDNAPQASVNFEFDSGGSGATATHDGGDTIDQARISLTTSGTGSVSKNTTPSEYAAGDNFGTYSGLSSGEEIRVVWTSDSGGSSATLGQATAP